MGEGLAHGRSPHSTATRRPQRDRALAPLAGGALWLALALLGQPGAARAEGGLGLLMAGPSCPDGAVSAQLEAGLARRAQVAVPHPQVAAALARVRADRAVAQARDLFRRTDFDGCIALLSITEQELGRNLADPEEAALRRAHELLSQVNIWLGICQWAAGDPQTAAGSFLRSAQLPASPPPDPALLPPELIEAHRAALSAPRQDVDCELLPPLRFDQILIDGRRPDLEGERRFRVAAGTHYVTLRPGCPAGQPGCGAGGESRSLRLEASTLRCRVQVPSRMGASRITCASPSEAGEPAFVAALTRACRAEGIVTVSQTGQRLGLHLQRRGSNGFARQIVSELEGQDSPAQLVGRSIGLLLGVEEAPAAPRAVPWYNHWWVWALVGATVVATATTAVAISHTPTPRYEYRIVFGP